MGYRCFFLFFFAVVSYSHGQYRFVGQLPDDSRDKTVYLSVIEDYRKLSRISFEQIFKKTQADSVGSFRFEGENLPTQNRIYRIHIDACDAGETDAEHLFGRCKDTKSISFIANNTDTLSFRRTFADEVFCDLTSTNPKSDALLQINMLKEEMAFDFSDFRSAANRKLNTKKWFRQLQLFGQNLNEPLAELYIYDFLSDRRNETYSYYSTDVVQNEYYGDLRARLMKAYPNTTFTRLYRDEIAIDQHSFPSKETNGLNWKWILGGLLGLSVLLNLFLYHRNRKKSNKTVAFEKLTAQEKKIVASILNDKTNKEIATELFISHSTVKTHINNLYKKLNVSDRDEIKALF